MSLIMCIFNMFLQACSQCCMYATCFADRTRYTCHWLQTRFQEHGIRKNIGNTEENNKKIHKETNTNQNKANKTAANQTTLPLNTQVNRTVNHEIRSKITFVRDMFFLRNEGTSFLMFTVCRHRCLLRVYTLVYPNPLFISEWGFQMESAFTGVYLGKRGVYPGNAQNRLF